jgi:phospholipid/cholesterol/gamma-HCH transport system substrate-binding protein
MMARPRAVVALLATLVLVSGCSSFGFKGAASLPLPGGAAHGKTYHVTAIFSDVQDLTVQNTVRVNDVAVGDVTSITLGEHKNQPGYLKANVGMSIDASVHLPRNATATLDQTTLLGEKFVSLAPPTGAGPVGTLANNDVISAGSSSESPSVEEVFGLLSQVLNGGDLQDLQTIQVEVSKALTGREQAVRGALTQLTTFIGGLNAQKAQIVRALDSLDQFTTALDRQDGTIDTALTELGPGLKVLANEHSQFTSLLSHLSTLGKVASHVINASRAQTVTGLRDLQPILQHLAAAGGALPRSLEILITFPFPRDSSQAAPGDYYNLNATIDLSPVLCAALTTFTGSTLTSILGADGGLLNELGAIDCPTVGTTSKGNGKGNGSGGLPGLGGLGGLTSTLPGGVTPPTVPTPSPTAGGLGGLINGLIGGGG